MNPAGALLVVLGLWISTQVWGGNVLQRLNITQGKTSQLAPIQPHAGGGDGGGGGGSF